MHIDYLSKQFQTDIFVFQGLKRALIEKKAFVKINFKYLNKFNSPFFNPWENLPPLLLIIALSLLLMFTDSLIVGTVVLMVFCIGYVCLMPYFLEPFVCNRVFKQLIFGFEQFLFAWNYGGFSIVLTADPRYFCQAPIGDWKKFTQTYFSDLVLKNMEEIKNE